MTDNLDEHEYWEARLSERYDLTGVGYTGLGKEYNAQLYRLRSHVFLTRVQSHLSGLDKAEVLDIGSGTGFYIDLWDRLGARSVVGSDLTSVAVDRLSAMNPEKVFIQADIGGSVEGFGGRTFDHISALDVLFHIMDDRKYAQAITNIYSLLNENGRFIFSENFVHKSRVTGSAQTSRSLELISSLVTSTGFTIIDRFPMFWIMNSPVDSNSRLLKSWWRLLTLAVSRSELAGKTIGKLIYPIEKYLVGHMSESPSTEIMICSKEAI